MEERIIEETNKLMQKVMDAGIEQNNNLENLDKLIDIKKDAIEIKCIEEEKDMYRDYERRPGFDSYGRDNYGNEYRDSYNRRGYDSKYRGHEYLERMSDDYNRYMYGRERYGNNEETKKSLKYMLESMEDFARKLRDEAQSQEEVQMIRETAQRIAQM